MYAVVLITTPSRIEAESLTTSLLRANLAACVNLLEVSSYYWWKGEIEDVNETLMIIKTKLKLADSIVRFVRTHHSYEVPEVIVLPIIQGNKAYLDWIGDTVKGESG